MPHKDVNFYPKTASNWTSRMARIRTWFLSRVLCTKRVNKRILTDVIYFAIPQLKFSKYSNATSVNWTHRKDRVSFIAPGGVCTHIAATGTAEILEHPVMRWSLKYKWCVKMPCMSLSYANVFKIIVMYSTGPRTETKSTPFTSSFMW